jgi:hypothetical protein
MLSREERDEARADEFRCLDCEAPLLYPRPGGRCAACRGDDVLRDREA